MSQTLAMPTTTLGGTGRVVSRVGLGGEGVLRTQRRDAEAREVIESAIEAGITYFDSARVYQNSELYYGGVWSRRPADRDRCFLTSKSAQRHAGGARRELEETLRRLKVDHLDLWQIHDLRTLEDLDELQAPGGALEAFLKAKDDGDVRFIGVTGHHDPAVLTRAVQELPVDTVLLPANPMEGALGGFLTETVPAARARGLGVIGMKALGGAAQVGGAGGGLLPRAGVPADQLLRYALGLDVDVLIVGCARIEEVAALREAAIAGPLEPAAEAALVESIRSQAKNLAGYRGTF